MGRQTPLFQLHQELGARIVDFGGWDMPVQYSSQIGRAPRGAPRGRRVRRLAHVRRRSERARACAASSRTCSPTTSGRSACPARRCTAACSTRPAGVLDDLIVYYLGESWFRLVVNAGTRDKDLAWIRRHGRRVRVSGCSERTDLAMLAVQGPQARAKTRPAAAHRGARLRPWRSDPFIGREMRGLVRRAHRLHRRGWLRGDDAGCRCRAGMARA